MDNNKIEQLLQQILENQAKIQSDIKTLNSKVDFLTNNLDFINVAIDVIKDTTGSHEMDIKILKKLRNTHSL